jgi:hypothetical protein
MIENEGKKNYQRNKIETPFQSIKTKEKNE